MYQDYITGQTEFVLTYNYNLPNNHIARLINIFVDSIPTTELLESNVATTGRPRFHPALMLKILMFAYSRQTYSGRKIEMMLEENLPMRWLAQDRNISYHTINDFRTSAHAARLIKKAFILFSMALKEHGLIQTDAIFIDGTKVEADANKYSFVWKRAIEKFDSRLNEKTAELYDDLVERRVVKAMAPELVNTVEGMESMANDVEEEISKLNEEIEQEPAVIKGGSPRKRKRRSLKKAHRKLTQDFIPRKKKYVEAKRTFKGRNSFSKTDHDATFMCMKEDPMKNRELKPGYNLQIATNNQFVLDFGLFSNPTDTRTLIPFLSQFQFLNDFNYVVADAGYASESNYTTIIDHFEKEPIIPYGSFRKEQTRKYKKDPTNRHNWKYNAEDDYYIDHLGVQFSFTKYRKRKDTYGFERDIKVYCADTNQLSPELDLLAKTPTGRQRTIEVNQTWDYFKEKMKDNLFNDEGQSIYARRKIDVEPIFGRMKRDFGVRRTHLRGQQAVENDIGLILMTMNLTKLSKMMA